MPTVGAASLPFLAAVNPKPVEAPAARVPFQLGFTVMTLPSQVGVPFQREETDCWAGRVTVTVQALIGSSPAVMVTWPL